MTLRTLALGAGVVFLTTRFYKAFNGAATRPLPAAKRADPTFVPDDAAAVAPAPTSTHTVDEHHTA